MDFTSHLHKDEMLLSGEKMEVTLLTWPSCAYIKLAYFDYSCQHYNSILLISL